MFIHAGKPEVFPRNEHVDVHVRTVTMAVGENAPDAAKGEYVEIREFIKSSGLYGHGIVLPALQVKDLVCALGRVTE